MHIGAHVSAAGGLPKAIGRAQDIGAEAMQIFASSPRAWRFKSPEDALVEKFKEASEEAGMGPTVFHGIYLCALGSQDEALVERSIESLTNHLQTAERAGALGVIFHPASHKGVGFEAVLDQFVEGVKKVLDAAPGDALLMLENSAGAGDHIGSKFSELGAIIKNVGSERVHVCLDTQHAWAAGYELNDAEKLDAMLAEFDKEIGLDRLSAIHANDSMRPLGSAVDRHDNIGEGEIGVAGFELMMSRPAFADVPMYLEVPGFEKGGPDKKNVDLMKDARKAAGASR
ncbi:MAG: deoxyribonuclease IV [Chloroflexi bacterium]|jgi:deoxyribonuclease IV|nr:deoxyribonuclease IV [Chloroflexota bacterium]MBT4074757.1 deoxyribonuclease IV [Chloroflexota bacterium]MBT4514908.1 deoxyribonuclease IV [Chloroflexota bacterium]MBT6681910.1 deoxyribonuclease IV [Chloroflexota bacterium]